MLGLAGAGPPKFHVRVWPCTRGKVACSKPTDREIEMFLPLGIRALGELAGHLPEVRQAPLRIARREGVGGHRRLEVLDGQSHIGARARRHDPRNPRAPGPAVTAESAGPRGVSPHPQPVVEIALRAKVLRRDEDAPTGSERPRKRDSPVGRIAVERHLDPARQAEQRLPCRLPGRECCRARDLK